MNAQAAYDRSRASAPPRIFDPEFYPTPRPVIDRMLAKVSRLRSEGLTLKDIGRRFGITYAQVWNITTGRQRKDA